MRAHAASEASGKGDVRLPTQKHTQCKNIVAKRSIKLLDDIYDTRQTSIMELHLFDVKEVCDMLKIGRSTLNSLVAKGDLRTAQVGVKRTLFTFDSIRDYIKKLNEEG